jgi:hypothetical protein
MSFIGRTCEGWVILDAVSILMIGLLSCSSSRQVLSYLFLQGTRSAKSRSRAPSLTTLREAGISSAKKVLTIVDALEILQSFRYLITV